MVSYARKNLFAEKTRFVVSAVGVAFSVFLMIFLFGIYNAFSIIATAYLNNTGADIIITQEGARSMSHTYSILEKSKIGLAESISGGKAYGLVSRTTNALIREEDGSRIVDFPGRKKAENIEGKKSQIAIVGFDTKSSIGGPWIMLEGDSIPGRREIVIDKVFAKKNDLAIGDQIEAFGKILTISGVTDKNNMLIYSRGFMNISEEQQILKEKDTVNFILIKLPKNVQVDAIVEKLEKEIDGITAYKMSEFAKINGEEITDSFLPIILVVTIIGFLTGAVVIGMTIYTSTIEKIREFGVLKAIGASNKTLFFIVFEQALWYALIGFLGGIVLTSVITRIAKELVPVIIAEYSSMIYLSSFSLALLMSVTASFIPIRRISNIDPAMVFKA